MANAALAFAPTPESGLLPRVQAPAQACEIPGKLRSSLVPAGGRSRSVAAAGAWGGFLPRTLVRD